MADTFLNPVELAEIGSTPSNPPSGYKKIYAKTDGKVYALNAAGEEVELTPALVISAGTNSRNTGNVTFANSNGVTFGMDTNGQITASHNGLTTAAQSNHSHGAIAYSGTNVSASFTSASNGLSIQLSADAGGVQSADTNKAGTGFSTTTTNAGSNIAGTLGTNGLNLAVPNYLTTFIQSADTNKAGTLLSSNAVGGVNVGGSINSNGLTLNIPAFITTAAQSNHSHGDIAFSGTNVSASFTSASNGLSIQLSAPAGGTGGGGGVAIAGGTNTQTSGTVNFSNSNGVTFGLNTNGVMTAAGGGAIAAGTQVATQGTVSFANSNGVSFGMSGSSQITAQIAPHTYTLIGNVAGDSTVSGANFVFSGGNNLTLSGTSNTIVFSAANGGGGAAPSRSYVEINQGERLTTIRNFSETIFSNRPFFFPFWMDGTGVRPNTVRMFVSGIASSNRSLGLTLDVGIYSQVNTSQMLLLGTAQQSYSITASGDSSRWNGPAVFDITGMSNLTFTAEGRYMLAMVVRPVSANATWANMAFYGCDPYPNFSRVMSGNTTAATNATQQLLPWQGAYSTTSNALPNTIAKTQINGGNSASAIQPYAVIMGV